MTMTKQRSTGHLGPQSRITPGPWGWVNDGQTCNVYAEIKDGPTHGIFCIAEVASDAFLQHVGGSMEGNARLIAAAPRLLEACEGLLRLDIREDANGSADDAIIAARDAIAAAKTGGAA